MFRLPDGTLRFSPRDLIAYLEGDFSAWCDRMDAERVRADPAVAPAPGWFRADPKDAELDLVARKGLEHEGRFLARVKAGEPGLVELAQGDSATADTLAAMRAGAPVIFQGHLAVGAWHGYPDFLFRTPGPSALGDYHYVAWDTKLARSARPYFLVQLCAYADLLETIQRVRPAELVFVLGNEDELHFETVHYFAYYRQIRRSFLGFQKTWSPDCIPHPGFDRSWGRWSDAAEQRLDETDHLSRVARISRAQIRRLGEVGIATLRHLAETDVAGVPSIKAPIFDRLRLQARLQYRSTEGAPPLWELVPPPPNEPRRGLVLLPPPSPLDVFFDMEGFPFARDGGLEYLFGASVPQGEAPAFRDWWAHDDAGEQRAFEGFIDWVMERRKRDPDLHVYHYASYEVTAVKRLAGKYATREAEVDDLLRGDVFVDLYAVVR
ncbi:MAG: TM0106 family RecB-like putative nuclease, partial [Gemmatimonadales bacterium]|nr:TM0106 family RecB-like putative nuclease [Gemmatimonadales bacterium]